MSEGIIFSLVNEEEKRDQDQESAQTQSKVECAWWETSVHCEFL
jgi:hypothetical protein